MSRPIRIGPASPPPARDVADHWTTAAACGNDDGRNLHDLAHESERYWPLAAALCNGCPVRTQCATEHLDEQYGIWGGLNPDQRAQLRGESPRLGRTLKSAATLRTCDLPGCNVTFEANGPKRFCMRSHQMRYQNRLDKKRAREAAKAERKGTAA